MAAREAALEEDTGAASAKVAGPTEAVRAEASAVEEVSTAGAAHMAAAPDGTK